MSHPVLAVGAHDEDPDPKPSEVSPAGNVGQKEPSAPVDDTTLAVGQRESQRSV